jgi:hypothetical protein
MSWKVWITFNAWYEYVLPKYLGCTLYMQEHQEKTFSITWATPREIQQVLLPKVGWNTNPKPKTHQLGIQLDDTWQCSQITSIKH